MIDGTSFAVGLAVGIAAGKSENKTKDKKDVEEKGILEQDDKEE